MAIPMSYRLSVVALSVALLGGCASTQALNHVSAEQSRYKAQAKTSAASVPDVLEKDVPYVAPRAVRYVASSDEVNLHADGLPIGQALREILPRGWSLSFATGTHAKTSVSIDLSHVGRNSAIQQIALGAGDVAVINAAHRRVTIATQATYLFRVPVGLLGAQSASMRVSSSSSIGGGSAGGGGTSGSLGPSPGGASGGASGGGGGNGASFNVAGQTERSGFLTTIKSLVGPGGSVSMDNLSGLVSVTAKAGGLMRVQSYIRAYASAANTQIEIHAAILEVQLNKGLSTGIQWNRILSAGTNGLSMALNAAAPSIAQVVSGSGSSTFSITRTGTSLNGVIHALQSVTKVRVVTAPWLIAANGTPATINSGTQVPYVGDVQNNVTGLSGTSTTGASLSYANNGVSLSFVPQVLGDGWVQLAVIPSLSSIQKFINFDVNGQTLNGPVMQQRQAFVRLRAKTGQTIILGGSISQSANQQTNGIPGLSRIPILGGLFGNYGQGTERTQLVILVRVKIIPAPKIDPLIGESL